MDFLGDVMARSEKRGAGRGRGVRSKNGRAPYDPSRILIADDEKGIRRLFKVILASALPDRKIDVAVNGAEAVEFFSQGHHGVLLMDLRMPVMDGHAAFREIDRMCKVRNWEMPAVVFCTGFMPPSTVREIVAQGGAHSLLPKPVSSDTLVATVKTCLARE